MPEIICIYCNTPWTEEMLNQMEFCEGSYTPDCIESKLGKIKKTKKTKTITTTTCIQGQSPITKTEQKEMTEYKRLDITCPNCKKLIYRKEIDELLEQYDTERWKNFYN